MYIDQISGLGIPEDSYSLTEILSQEGYKAGGFAHNGFISRTFDYNRGFDEFQNIEEFRGDNHLIKRLGKVVNDSLDSKFLTKNLFRPLHKVIFRKEIFQDNFRPAGHDGIITSNAIEWVKQQESNGWFLWVHFMDAHTPYGRYPEHLKKIRGDTDVEHTRHPGRDELVVSGEQPDQVAIDTYDAAIRSVDEHVETLLEHVPEDATVVLTGDHGEEFGRYGSFHSESLHASMTQIPLIVRSSNVEPGHYSTPVSHLDIAPTLLHDAGIDIPDHWMGEPLQVCDRDDDAAVFLTMNDGLKAVRMGEWKLIETDSGHELYRVDGTGETRVREEQETDLFEELRSTLDQFDCRIEPEYTAIVGESQEEATRSVEDNLKRLGYID
jgi:arylsulfatase A-like enzyme